MFSFSILVNIIRGNFLSKAQYLGIYQKVNPELNDVCIFSWIQIKKGYFWLKETRNCNYNYRLLRRRSLGRAVATAASGDERDTVGSGHHGPQPGQAVYVQQLLRRHCLPRPLPVPGPLARVRMRVSTYIFLHYNLHRFLFNFCFIKKFFESCTQHYEVFKITYCTCTSILYFCVLFKREGKTNFNQANVCTYENFLWTIQWCFQHLVV